MSESNLTLIAEVLETGAAQMIRGYLETNEIPCFIFDERLSGIGIGMIPIRLMVREQDVEKAKLLLRDIENDTAH